MQNLSISLCMIVKDEEENLSACLQSVQGAVDEIIVVDTGSTDDTVAIARRFGAKVVCSSWNGDFAAARNIGIEEARGDWILFLDADERLEKKDRDKLRICAQHEEYEAFLLHIYNYTGNEQEGATINPVVRMFRNRPEYRFEGRIHEQIASVICRERPKAAFHITDIIVHHYGYRSEIVERKDKITRNLQILKQVLAENPDDGFHLYNIGVEYLRLGQVETAFHFFRKARLTIASESISFAHLLYKYEVRCLQALGRIQEALDLTEEGLRLVPEYTDLYHIKGVCCLQLGKVKEAKQALIQAVTLGSPPLGYHTEEGMGTYQSSYLLGQLYEDSGEYEAAIECYIETVRYKASLNPPLYRLCRLLRCIGKQEQIPELIRTRFKMQSPQAYKKLIEILLDMHCLQEAMEVSREIEDEAYQRFVRFQCSMRIGDLQKAKKELTGIRTGEYRMRQKLKRMSIWIEWISGHKNKAKQNMMNLVKRDKTKACKLLFRLLIEKEGTASERMTIDDESIRELCFGAESAFACGQQEITGQIIHLWKKGVVSDEADGAALALGLTRMMVEQADKHLETLMIPEREKSIQRIRLLLPHKDGF